MEQPHTSWIWLMKENNKLKSFNYFFLVSLFLPNLAYTHLKHMKAIFSFIEAIELYTKEMYVLMWNLNQ